MEKNIYGLCGKKNVFEMRSEYTAKKEMWRDGVEVYFNTVEFLGCEKKIYMSDVQKKIYIYMK